MKQVYETDQIPHLWAHQTQESARNKQDNLYFSGDTIYSYGSHFPIARLIENGAGERAVLFTTDSYGSTTGQHINAVTRALPHDRVVFYVSDPLREPAKLADDYVDQIKAALELVIKPKIRKATQAKHYDAAVALVAQANAFAKFFKLKRRYDVPESMDAVAATLTAEREKAERAHKRAVAKAEREREQRFQIIRAEAVPNWIAGGRGLTEMIFRQTGSMGNLRELPEAYLRIATAHDDSGDIEIETSHGARVPVSHAIRAMRLIQKLRADFASRHAFADPSEVQAPLYKRNGHTIRIGHYSLDEIRADGTIVAGCHTITPQEFDRFAAIIDGMEVSEL